MTEQPNTGLDRKLTLIAARDLLGVDIPWIAAGWIGAAVLLIRGTYLWPALRPLRRYLAVMGLIVLGAVLLAGTPRRDTFLAVGDLGAPLGGRAVNEAGAIQSGLLAVLMGKAIVDTRGLGWPWFIHAAIEGVIYFTRATDLS